jgi:hypothetical protein
MKTFGKLCHLRKETSRINRIIEEDKAPQSRRRWKESAFRLS